ncbi:TnsA endonuclease N-terminal domain-containing protein [Paenibacillus sp. MMS18-CY102]|uniref:TnsA endonuclease N-terminal domain-containing protein n=1 Tax=Paenibacillus sp. MMS18-CY102 TaxID=2682849 RepID=UPI0013653F67|nr:TnsA endonuclease N-terminal domain-containing protein [Paenibacillus sp. MMS18-CY102]
MSRYRRITEATMAQLVKEGRGQGRGQDYKPWLTVRDVPSRGLSTRDKGWTTGRVHHVLSNLELEYLYTLDWNADVTDIREQYPLQIDETLDIAKRLGIKHPFVNKYNEYAVMTTDFLVDSVFNDSPVLLARSIKTESDLLSKRTLEKIMIEQLYWKERGIDFKVVTEKQIQRNLAWNVGFIHSAKASMDTLVSPQMLWLIEKRLFTMLQQQHSSYAKVALENDQALGMEGGTSLWVIKHLIANRIWEVNMSKKIDPGYPLEVQRREGF